MAASVTTAVRDWGREILAGWNRFWFAAADPATLGLIRVLGGAMMFYTHAVWSIGLTDFLGPRGLLPAESVKLLQQDTYAFSYLWWVEGSPALLWTAHIAALVVLAMLTLGLFTRVTSILALVITLSYVQRMPGALFGLDQVNTMLALYLAVGPSGDAYSLDRWLRSRRVGAQLPVRHSWMANLAVRLIQVHMCIVYLFAGMAKLVGMAWWDGTALWMAFGNLEYQSLDMTWMASYPLLINLMTHVTIAWELSYWALVWPRLSRPIVLALAVPLHMGIAICLGMITFGLAMLIGNLAFVPPWLVRGAVDRMLAAFGRGRAGRPTTAPGEPLKKPSRPQLRSSGGAR